MDLIGSNFGTPISSHTTGYLTDPTNLFILVTCDTTPETTQLGTYQVGCLLIRTDNGTMYQMTGTTANPSWSANGTGARGSQGSAGSLGSTGATGPTGPPGSQGSQGSQGTG